MKAAMHIGARTIKTRSIKASSWRKGKGKATYEIFRACIIAAVPSERTWYVRESSGGGMPRPPLSSLVVIRRTIHVLTT